MYDREIPMRDNVHSHSILSSIESIIQYLNSPRKSNEKIDKND
jgi:hypothetical protein